MTRLRYFKTELNTLQSHPFLLETRLVYIVLYTNTLEFNIVDRDECMLIVNGFANTLAELKKQAKSTAIAFGGKFSSEFRKQTKLDLDKL